MKSQSVPDQEEAKFLRELTHELAGSLHVLNFVLHEILENPAKIQEIRTRELLKKNLSSSKNQFEALRKWIAFGQFQDTATAVGTFSEIVGLPIEIDSKTENTQISPVSFFSILSIIKLFRAEEAGSNQKLLQKISIENVEPKSIKLRLIFENPKSVMSSKLIEKCLKIAGISEYIENESCFVLELAKALKHS